jgi:hypothetical protein
MTKYYKIRKVTDTILYRNFVREKFFLSIKLPYLLVITLRYSSKKGEGQHS